MSIEFPEPERPDEEQETLDQLAAVHAALNPNRLAIHLDVLDSAIVEVLARRGPMAVPALTQAVCDMWGTTSVVESEVAAALNAAFEANLVSRANNLADEEEWAATDAARQAADQDRTFASRLIQAFNDELGARLHDATEARISDDRIPKLGARLFSALAAGAEGVYDLAPNDGRETVIRPIRFDVGAINRSLSGIDPKPVRLAITELAAAVVDPEDSFGNQVVTLLTVGRLLQALLARRDLPTKPDLTGCRLLLDMNVLLDLINDSDPAQAVLLQLIEIADRLGVEVVVAEHTLEEWDGHWEVAEEEVAQTQLPEIVPEGTHRLAKIQLVQFFLKAREADQSVNWPRFQRGRRDLRPRLAELGITVRPHGNKSDFDLELVTAIRDKLLELSDDETVAGYRSKSGAQRDADSYTTVVRWRNESDPPAGQSYFVAHERLTGQAFEEVVGDLSKSEALTVSPASWVMYATPLVADDPAEAADLAELVASASIRESFLGVATGYNLADALSMADYMAGGEHSLSATDTRAAIQLQMVELFEQAENGEEAPRRRAAAVVQRRSARATDRAARIEKDANSRAERTKQEADAKVSNALAEATEASTARQKALRRAESSESRAAALQTDLDKTATKAAERGRAFILLATVTVLAGLTATVWAVTGLGWAWALVGAAVIAIFTGLGAQYVKGEMSLAVLLVSAATEVGLVVLGSALAVALDDEVDDESGSAPGTVVSLDAAIESGLACKGCLLELDHAGTNGRFTLPHDAMALASIHRSAPDGRGEGRLA